jgi:hypothetical protein
MSVDTTFYVQAETKEALDKVLDELVPDDIFSEGETHALGMLCRDYISSEMRRELKGTAAILLDETEGNHPTVEDLRTGVKIEVEALGLRESFYAILEEGDQKEKVQALMEEIQKRRGAPSHTTSPESDSPPAKSASPSSSASAEEVEAYLKAILGLVKLPKEEWNILKKTVGPHVDEKRGGLKKRTWEQHKTNPAIAKLCSQHKKTKREKEVTGPSDR